MNPLAFTMLNLALHAAGGGVSGCTGRGASDSAPHHYFQR